MVLAERASRGLKSKLVVAGLSLGLAVVAAELVLRMRAFNTVQARFDEELADQTQPSIGSLRRLSTNERIVYELKPGLQDVTFVKAPVSTNSLGFRSPEIQVEKPEGVIRVVGLGDSGMFGWGVREEEGYMAVLQRLLEEAHPEHEWEVVNTGVPGYNTVMEVETLRTKGLRLDPDIVLVGLVNNDLNLPVVLHKKKDYLALDESYLSSFVLERLGIRQPVTDLFVPIDRGSTSWELFAHDPELVDPQYRDMVGWGPFEGALDELAAMSADHGFEVVVMAIWWYDILKEMQARARERGFSTTTVVEAKGDAPAGIKWSLHEGLVLSEQDPHPSAKLHRMIGERVFQHLEEQGILDRAMGE